MTVFAYIVCEEDKEEMVAQLKELSRFGYEKDFVARPEPADTERILNQMSAGDILVGKSITQLRVELDVLYEFLNKMIQDDKRFLFLDEDLDSEKPRGKVFLQDVEMMYIMEKHLTLGKVYRMDGFYRQPGRPKIKDDQAKRILNLYENTECTIRQIAKEVGVSVGTVHKYVKNNRENKPLKREHH